MVVYATTSSAGGARGLFFLLTLSALCACGAQSSDRDASLFAVASVQQWGLPDQLREISGLAADQAGRLFAHDDERAVIYEIDGAQGRPIASFSLGAPAEVGDFEGLAIAPSGDFYLITSQGVLYKFREGRDGAYVEFEHIDIGLDAACEIEGLAHFAAENSLIIACKRNNDHAQRDTIAIYDWRLDAPLERVGIWLSVEEALLANAAGVERFRPSSIEIDTLSGRVLLLSANRGALAELSRSGEILAARTLGSDHVQAEGMTVAQDGSLLIADEGGDGQALLSRYERLSR